MGWAVSATLFPALPKPTRPSRILARAIDGGPLDIVVPGKTEIGRFTHKCGFDEWIPCTATESRRGILCPKCNPDPSQVPEAPQ